MNVQDAATVFKIVPSCQFMNKPILQTLYVPEEEEETLDDKVDDVIDNTFQTLT